MQRTPYNKALLPLIVLHLDPIRMAEAGYAYVVQDVRSRWASDGDVFFLYRDEFEDGFDSVEWASQLEFADGNVGMTGVSYMGGTTWHAAATAPPALRAIAPITAPNDFVEDMLWRGGALHWGTLENWSLLAIGPNALLRTGNLASIGQLVDDIDDFERWSRFMPIDAFPPARPDDDKFLPFFFETLRHPTADDFTRKLGVSDKHSAVRVPALIVAGWYDLLLSCDLAHYAAMKQEAATPEARDATKIVIGPWSHGMFLNTVGELDFGMRSAGAFLDMREDLTALHIRWFDRWLKGSNTGIDDEPPVKLFVQGINRWRGEDAWPLARAKDTPFYLGPHGSLSRDKPDSDVEPAAYVYDPQDPCPTKGGNILMPGHYARGPVDQRSILDRRDVLTYTSEPVERDMEVTGRVRAVLHASTSAPDTDWVVKLCDVHTDGRVFNVCDGILRARYRTSLTEPRLVEPGAIDAYEIDLWATSIVFRAGHRLAVIVTSSDFPRYDRNPNTGELGTQATTTTPALQRIFHDAARPSHIVLPVVEN